MTVYISAMTSSDWTDVSRIYQEGINTGHATFESRPPTSWEDWCKGKINQCSLVAHSNSGVVGWAALSPFSQRAVYVGVAQVSIYVSATARGMGVGSALMQELIRVSEANGIWTLQARIFPENESSLRLHIKHGFRNVGIMEKLGQMQFGLHKGQWRDVVLVERRSKRVGI